MREEKFCALGKPLGHPAEDDFPRCVHLAPGFITEHSARRRELLPQETLRLGLHSARSRKRSASVPGSRFPQCGLSFTLRHQPFGGFRSIGSTSITRTAPSTGFHFRYTLTTASVQKGTRSRPGTNSPMNEGRNSQCQPMSRIKAAIMVKSKMSSSGDITPSANKGKMTTCKASATMANARAARKRERGDFRNDSSSIAMPAKRRWANQTQIYSLLYLAQSKIWKVRFSETGP